MSTPIETSVNSLTYESIKIPSFKKGDLSTKTQNSLTPIAPQVTANYVYGNGIYVNVEVTVLINSTANVNSFEVHRFNEQKNNTTQNLNIICKCNYPNNDAQKFPWDLIPYTFSFEFKIGYTEEKKPNIKNLNTDITLNEPISNTTENNYVGKTNEPRETSEETETVVQPGIGTDNNGFHL